MNLNNCYERFADKMPEQKKCPFSSKKRLNKIISFFKEPVLDVGCSKGYDVNYFYNNGLKKISGCDISKKAIRVAKSNYSMNFFVHNFELKETSEKFNTIYCFDVIEHLFYTNEFLKNVFFSLALKGKLILSCPNVLSIRNRLNFLFGRGEFFVSENNDPHIRFFAVKTLEKKLKQIGFKKVLFFNNSRVPLIPNSLVGSITCVAFKQKECGQEK